MTDDLVKRLRHLVNDLYGSHPCGLINEAADRIEQLEAALRDQFAMAALTGIAANPQYDSWEWEKAAEQAYIASDAMLKAREKKE